MVLSVLNDGLDGAGETAYMTVLKDGHRYSASGAGEVDGGDGRIQGTTSESVSLCTPTKTQDESETESPNAGKARDVSEMIQSEARKEASLPTSMTRRRGLQSTIS